MDSKQLKKIYAAIEVLRNIGVEPSADQLSRLSQIEEDVLQQAAKTFGNEVNAVRRPFMLQLNYEPDNMSSLNIVIDDKTLPIALPKPTIEEKVPEKQQEATHAQPKSERAASIPTDDFFSSLYKKSGDDAKPKRIRRKYSLNGSRFMKKEDLVFEIIKLYVKHHPNATFSQLRQVFNDEYCAGKFKSIGFIVSEDDLDDLDESGKYNLYHGNMPEYRLVSADGIGFYNYSSWTHEAIMPIIELAESLGYRITTDK